ncbi:NAD(P)/FAD-dependent oxidoreductase [Phenylobacterium sp.]|jgi:glycine oxidase|uniref:NAD(P)/FAD-dependent oxidoreductase n=1 Tax=Phenylobacterium sp. TaxID=1871053 RepID=UPI002F930150
MAGAPEVTVAGAGALGLAAAVALADAGCAVTVCDPAPAAANASGVAAGMLAPAFEAALDPQTAGCLDVLLAARDLWPALEARTGVSVDRSGAVAVGSEGWLAAVRNAFGGLGLHLADVPRAALDDLTPGLSPVFARGLMTREDWRLEPLSALAALRRAAEASGVVFRTGPARPGDAWLVIATGASQDLADVASALKHLTPIKGHILRAATGAAGRVALRGEGAYAVAADGGLAIGATMEAGVADPTVEPAQETPLRKAGAKLFPAVAEAPVTLLAGVRAATPDGLPMVGLAGEKTVLAVGARRNGWLLAPLAARIVAACVTGRDPGPYAARLDPRRFGEAA